MKQNSILIALPCLKVGGTEMQTLRLVEALVAGGYHCVTVCYFEYDFVMRQRFEEAGSKVVCLSAYGKRPDSLRDTYKFLKSGLKRVVAEYRPKMAHVQYMAPGAMPIIILRRLGIKTLIATLHTDSSIYRNLRLVHYLQKYKTTAFTCVTEAAEKSFFGSSQLYDEEFVLKHHNHFTIHNCLSADFPWNDNNEMIQFEVPVIGIVARLERIKGVDFVMPAFAKVLKQLPDCQLMIVGDGQLHEEMTQQQQELGIKEKNVIWAGRVPYEKLAGYYKQMTLVWMPSRSEGFGLSAIEAMGHGHAVIASDTGGLIEIIHNGVDGLLIPSGDTEALATQSLKLLNDREKLKQMNAAALQNAKQFSFEHYKTQILSLYEKLEK